MPFRAEEWRRVEDAARRRYGGRIPQRNPLLDTITPLAAAAAAAVLMLLALRAGGVL